MAWFTQTLFSSLGKKYIMALTGLALGGFLVVHAAGNSSIMLGRGAFLSYASHLHAFGPLLHVAEVLLLIVFLLHISTGTLLFLQNTGSRTSRYTVNSGAGGRSWGSATMPYTGIVVFAFVIMHLLQFHFTDHSRSIADIVSSVLEKPIYTVLYAAGLGALGLHISHGFWSLFQSLGLNHPKYNGLIRVCAWVVCGAVVAVFITIVLLLVANSGLLA